MAPSVAELRRFAAVLAGGCAVLAVVGFARGRPLYPPLLLSLAVLLAVCAIRAPRALEPFQRIWMGIAQRVGRLNAEVMLSALFYLILTPVAWVRRRTHDPLDRSWADGRDTQWVRRPRRPADPRRYERPF
jgi:hypothetical protein